MSVRTALSIVQEFRRGITLDAPTALYGSTDPDEMKMLEHLGQVCEYLRKRGPFRQQIRNYTFNTASSTTTYSLPGDYWGAVPSTQYNQATQYPLLGPVSDQEFAFYRERGVSTPYEYVWRVAGFDATVSNVEGRLFEIYPSPSAVQAQSFDYISGNLYLPAAWFASPDTNIHETLSADTDYCVFDADLVKLGLLWKHRASSGASADLVREAKQQFDSEIEPSRMRFNGSRTGIFGPKKGRKWYPIIDGNWSFS